MKLLYYSLSSFETTPYLDLFRLANRASPDSFVVKSPALVLSDTGAATTERDNLERDTSIGRGHHVRAVEVVCLIWQTSWASKEGGWHS